MEQQNKTEGKLIGLSTAEAEEALNKYGPNTIDTKKISALIKVINWLRSPISILLLAASLLSFYTGKSFDGWFILFMFSLNFLIAQWYEYKADQALATLKKHLTVSIQTLREGSWQLITSDRLVPGDVVKLEVGNIIPADISIREAKNLSINEAVLTGESLPQDKTTGDNAFTGSFITTGNLIGTVIATANRTKFGKTVTMVDNRPKSSVLEKDILTISKFLMVASLITVIVITSYLIFRNQHLGNLLTLDISILIAGVPVAMPTVMSLIISLGVVQLTRKHVIVRRLSSLEDLANVNLLLSDKTGTLTKNEIEVEDIISYSQASESDIVRWAVSATTDNKLDPINQALLLKARQVNVRPYEQIDYTPADSNRKRSTAIVNLDNKHYTVSIGAAQIIEPLCHLDNKAKAKFKSDIELAANQGYRCLALAKSKGKEEKGMKLMGLLLLSDTLRPYANSVIEFLRQHGIAVKMITGDNHAIASRVAKTLGLKGGVISAAGNTGHLSKGNISSASVYSEVLPDDKFRIVKASEDAHFVTAVTGDGVNDLPALERASVGIAVNNAVDALKNAADIVLMTNGIGVIQNAILEARKIFMRTYYYSVYRISESFRLILSVAILSLIYGTFPLTPVQIILLALLNDLPIITLAYDRVEPSSKPAAIHVKERFSLASLYGTIGVLESLGLFFLMRYVFHLPLPIIQTMFFLKLAVSGHALIYVAHTKHHWWRWLPSKQVIWATTLTQLLASALALWGFLFHDINLWQVLLVWGWALVWMQFEEAAKQIFQRHFSI